MKAKPKKHSHSASPAVLPLRPKQKTAHYKRRGGAGYTLDTVSVDVSLSTKAGSYVAPEMEGDSFLVLRRYALILARYQLLNIPKHSKRHHLDARYFEAANRIIANAAYANAFSGDDPSDGTVFLDPLIKSINNEEFSADMLCAVASYYGTKAFWEILEAIIHPDIVASLGEMSGRLLKSYAYNDIARHMACINHEGTSHRSRAELGVAYLAMAIWQSSNLIPEKTKGKPIQVAPNGKPIDGEGLWETGIIGKPRLEISHSGLMGRRKVALQQGNKIRHLQRLITDPEMRIFGGKTRALGGVVVVDCSGSMSLTDEEMHEIMRSSAGCTVIGYSSGAEPTPNIYVLARNGRQVRHMPDWPGGNGVDGIALEYALQFRRYNAPMIWVSDTQVTGVSGSNEKLRQMCLDFCAKHNVHIVGNTQKATTLLTQLQAGRKVPLQQYNGRH